MSTSSEHEGLSENYVGNPEGISIPTNPEDAVIRLRGLPWTVTESEVVEFLRSGGVNSVGTENIYLLLSPSGRPSGEALAHLPATEEVPLALKLHRRNLGHRYVEVYESTQDELTKAMITARISVRNEPKNGLATSNVVRMRGLPYNVSLTEIEEFFDGLQIMVGGIHLMLGSDGRLNGDAFIEFTTEDFAREAMKKHRSLIGRRYIELFRSSKGELINILNQQGTIPKSNQQLIHLQQQRPQQSLQSQSPLLPQPFLSQQSLSYQTQQQNLMPQLGQYPNLAVQQFQLQQLLGQQPLTQQTSLNNLLGGSSLTYPGLVGNTGLEASQLNSTHDMTKLIKVRGLPYTASEVDIRQFFHDCKIVPNGIHIVLNDQGKPSGKGFLEFETLLDCQKACQKHRQMMGARYIEVYRSTLSEMMTELYGPEFQQQLTALTLLLQQQVQLASLGIDMNTLGMNLALTPQMTTPIQSLLTATPRVIPINSPLLTGQQTYAQTSSNKRSYDSSRSSPPSSPSRKRRPLAESEAPPRSSDAVTVRVKGLPPKCTEMDVLTFFEGCRVCQNGVRFLTRNDGVTAGEALIDFVSQADATKALQNHRNHFQGHSIEVSLSSESPQSN